MRQPAVMTIENSIAEEIRMPPSKFPGIKFSSGDLLGLIKVSRKLTDNVKTKNSQPEAQSRKQNLKAPDMVLIKWDANPLASNQIRINIKIVKILRISSIVSFSVLIKIENNTLKLKMKSTEKNKPEIIEIKPAHIAFKYFMMRKK